MNIKNFESEHRLIFESHEISFWNKHACTRADATHAMVSIGSWNYNFQIPAQDYELRTFCYMLEAAFARGKKAKALEIRKTIGLDI